MDHLIRPFQSSFIEGRKILDDALVASELIDSCKRKKIKATVLKLDFHKASTMFHGIFWIGFLFRWVSRSNGVNG